MEKTISIVVECHACNGTGLYSGFCEPKGEAVICIDCLGNGWEYYYYRPFNGRKKKRGIQKIRRSRGSFIPTGVGGDGEFMTYQEFEKKYKTNEPKC